MEFIKLPTRAKNYTGVRFGRLTVVGPILPTRKITSKFMWFCRCDCGGDTIAEARCLTAGVKKSCDCLRHEGPGLRKDALRHGECYSVEYTSWKKMTQRCNNPNDKKYSDYGGRGIVVCERWLVFENFLADMGKKPGTSYTIDRFPDNNGNYELDNCRWATKRQQQQNRRVNIIVTAFGKTACLAEFFEHSHTPEYDRAHYRIMAGWDAERAITAPPHSGRIG